MRFPAFPQVRLREPRHDCCDTERMITSRRLSPALLAVGLVLTGCSGDGSEKADAGAITECQNIASELQQIGDDVSSLPGKIPGDLAGAEETVKSAIGRAGGLSDTVTDPELRAKLSTLTDSLSDLQKKADNAASDPVGNASALLKSVSNTSTAYNELKDYCGV